MNLSSSIKQVPVETGVVMIQRIVHAVSVGQINPEPVSTLQWDDTGVGS